MTFDKWKDIGRTNPWKALTSFSKNRSRTVFVYLLRLTLISSVVKTAFNDLELPGWPAAWLLDVGASRPTFWPSLARTPICGMRLIVWMNFALMGDSSSGCSSRTSTPASGLCWLLEDLVVGRGGDELEKEPRLKGIGGESESRLASKSWSTTAISLSKNKKRSFKKLYFLSNIFKNSHHWKNAIRCHREWSRSHHLQLRPKLGDGDCFLYA